MTKGGQRDFIVATLRDMEGNAVLSLATGRSKPTDTAPLGKLEIKEHHWFAYPAELDLMVEFAERAYDDGRDAYISPLIYGAKPYVDKNGNVVMRDRHGRPLFSRGRDNALFSQTIYMDSDSCPPEAFRVPPSRHVNTSEGHGHDYWYLATPIPARLAADIAHRITTAHKDDGSDPSGWSANKVLRLPTFNTTYDELSPYPVTWTEETPANGDVYADTDLDQIYGDIEVAPMADPERPLPPVPLLEGLPKFEDLADRIPATARRLNDLIYKEPRRGEKGWASEQRFALLLDLKRFGFSDEETIAIAWHSPAAAKWREDARGVDGLWWELQVKVQPILAEERGETIEAAPLVIAKANTGPKLLTTAQREWVEARSDLLTLYLAYSRSKVQTPNMPYHIINGWVLLSLGLSEAIELPKEPDPLGTGLFTISLGRSSTGKDEAENVLISCKLRLYPSNHPDIPAASSRESLIENLIARDGQVSYIQSNEADGLLGQMKQGGIATGIFQYWTQAYDGRVPALGRVGKQDLNKPNTRAILTMHLVGTPEGMLKVVDKSMFYSGYLARQIWVLGDDIETTEATLKSKFSTGDEVQRVHDGVPKYLGLHFQTLRNRLRSNLALDRKRASIRPTDEAIELLDAAKWKIHKHIEREHDVELWKPVLRRFGDILWKIAALSAASDSRLVIGTRDVQVALYYAETWVANVMEISDRISDTFFSKQCDEIEKFIAAREGKSAELGAIYRFRKGEPKRVTDEYLQSLVFQGRIHETTPKKDGPRHYQIKEPKT